METIRDASEDDDFRPTLLVDRASGRCFLADSEAELAAIRLSAELGPEVPAVAFVVLDLKDAKARLDAATEGATRFTLAEIATLCGVSYAIVWRWLDSGTIRASIKPQQGPGAGKRSVVFSRGDAFGASIIASFHAAGCERPLLERISREIVFRDRSAAPLPAPAESSPSLASEA